MEKKILEMNNSELFSVLTGCYGPMAQFFLRKVILSYRSTHDGNSASLEEMVRSYELPKSA
jgi:hypothetical protein